MHPSPPLERGRGEVYFFLYNNLAVILITSTINVSTIAAANALFCTSSIGELNWKKIDSGKVANIVVTDGDLLEPRTNIKYLFITGRMVPLTSRHTELFEQFKDRK